MNPCNPVAYDKSIRIKGRNFVASVRMDARTWDFERHSMLEAQKLLDCFPPDVYEGPNSAPPSLFWKGSVCETLVM